MGGESSLRLEHDKAMPASYTSSSMKCFSVEICWFDSDSEKKDLAVPLVVNASITITLERVEGAS